MPRKKKIEEVEEVKEEKPELKEFKVTDSIEAFNKKSVEKRKRKAVFIERFLAFFIDTLIISFACSIIAVPFVNTNHLAELQDEQEKISREITELSTSTKDIKELITKMKNKMQELGELSFEISRTEGAVSLIIIIAELLYFVVYQLIRDGQTLGKKLLKIRVKSTIDDKLTSNQLLFRSLIINSILFNIIEFAFMVFSNKYVYWPSIVIFNFVQNLILMICGLMVMFRQDGRGLHDVICKTEVIKE